MQIIAPMNPNAWSPETRQSRTLPMANELAAIADRARTEARRLSGLLGTSASAAEVDAVIAGLDSAIEGQLYAPVPTAALGRWQNAAASSGNPALFNALLLASLIARSEARAKARMLSGPILEGFAERMIRILDGLARAPEGRLDAADDVFLKDLGICRMEVFPCAAQVVERHSGVARDLVRLGGPGQIGRMAELARLTGLRFRPFLEIHTHTPMLPDFNDAGWKRCYHMVAALLERFDDHVGLVGGSWFYDPAVETVSPRLAYLRQVPAQGGAIILQARATQADIDNATATSASRRQLFEQGKYLPQKYLMVWPRSRLIAWSRQNGGSTQA